MTLLVTDVGAHASVVAATNLSSSPCMRSPVTLPLFPPFSKLRWSSVEVSASNFTPRGEEKKAPYKPPCPPPYYQWDSLQTLSVSLWLNMQFSLCAVRILGSGLNHKMLQHIPEEVRGSWCNSFQAPGYTVYFWAKGLTFDMWWGTSAFLLSLKWVYKLWFLH